MASFLESSLPPQKKVAHVTCGVDAARVLATRRALPGVGRFFFEATGEVSRTSTGNAVNVGLVFSNYV